MTEVLLQRTPVRWLAEGRASSSPMEAKLVLIVGLSPAGLVVARNVLTRAGYQVVTSGTLGEGLRLARQIDPLVLLLDDAITQANALPRILELVPATCRVVLSVPRGRGAEFTSACMAAQAWPLSRAVAVIQKPYEGEALLRAVEGSRQGEGAPLIAAPIEDEEDTVVIEEVVLSGRLGPISVEQVLQLAENTPAPVCARFDDGQARIEVYLQDQRVTFARCMGTETKVEAVVYALLRWKQGFFSLVTHGTPPAGAARVSLTLAPLLLEGMFQLDQALLAGAAQA